VKKILLYISYLVALLVSLTGCGSSDSERAITSTTQIETSTSTATTSPPETTSTTSTTSTTEVIDPAAVFLQQVKGCSELEPLISPIDHQEDWTHSFESYALTCTQPYEWGGISFDANWIQISGTPADTQINNVIQDFMGVQIDQYLDWALESAELNKENELSYITDSYAGWGMSIAFDDPDILSLVTDNWSFFSGGANGSAAYFSFNFDPKNSQPIELVDLFIEGSDWVTILGDAAHISITNQIEDEEIVNPPESWWNWPESIFESFAFTTEGLVVLFNEYEIGPGVLGALSGTISWDVLAEIIDPSSPAGKFLSP
tara:strand:- start:1126 stop:2076 length:951 start_codon:yes stop_codon:yes gene_type:complete